MKQKTNEENIMVMESMQTTSTCSSQEYVLENVADTQASNEGKINIVPITELTTDEGKSLPASEVTKLLTPNQLGVTIVVDGNTRTVRPLVFSEDGVATPQKIGFSERAYFVKDSTSSQEGFRILQNRAVGGG